MSSQLILTKVLAARRPDFRYGVTAAIIGVFFLIFALLANGSDFFNAPTCSFDHYFGVERCYRGNGIAITGFIFFFVSFIPLLVQMRKLRRLESCVRLEAMGDYYAALELAKRYANPNLLVVFREKYNLNRRPVQQYAQQRNPPMQPMPPQMNYGTIAVPQIINIDNSNHAHNTNNAHLNHNNQTMNVHDSVVQGSLGANHQQPPNND